MRVVAGPDPSLTQGADAVEACPELNSETCIAGDMRAGESASTRTPDAGIRGEPGHVAPAHPGRKQLPGGGDVPQFAQQHA